MATTSASSTASDFAAASSFLSSSSLPLPNTTKLRLYALFKISKSRAAVPPTGRPALWDFEGRAKWDAWKKTGEELQKKSGGGDNEVGNQAEEEYVKLAEELGWKRATSSHEPQDGLQPRGSAASSHLPGTGVGWVNVSRMADPNPPPDPHAPLTLHDFAMDGEAERLLSLIRSQDSSVDLNERNENGCTPLHLAADAGHLDVVRALLDAGALVDVKDEDGLTAEDLAAEAGREECRALLATRRRV